MKRKKNRKKRHVFLLFLFSFFLWGAGYYYYKEVEKKKKDDHFNITSIIQTGLEKEVLKTAYLAELMDLSVDLPTNLYLFDCKKARKWLLASPLIKEAKVKKMPPQTIYVDYSVRQPIAWVVDYENIAIDEDGYLFPVSPFLSPKHLPQIFLGIALEEKEKIDWNFSIQEKNFSLAQKLLHIFAQPEIKKLFLVKWIDTSAVSLASYGKREIIVLLENEMRIKQQEKEKIFLFPHLLRLNVTHFQEQLGNYLVLREKMLFDYKKQLTKTDISKDFVHFKTKVIDLRIEKLAFVDEKF